MCLGKQLSSDQGSQFPFHFDLDAFPRPLGVDDNAVHKRAEIAHQRPTVVFCAGVISHRFGKLIDRLDIAIEGRWGLLQAQLAPPQPAISCVYRKPYRS
jgi:hypothetical protein